VDPGIVDIETNELWEIMRMHRDNFKRYLRKKTGGDMRNCGRNYRLRTRGWCCLLQSTRLEDQRIFRTSEEEERGNEGIDGCVRGQGK